MPTAPTKRAAKKATKPAPAPAPAPEPVDEDLEDADEADELEELEADEVAEGGAKKRGSDEVTFGVADVCALISKGRDKKVTPRELRQLIRKMAREETPRVNREIKAGNRQRYSWSGPNDPEVKAIVAAFNGGELEADKQEKLKALKERKAAKAETQVPAQQTRKGSKKAAAPVVEEDVEELELDDEDDDES